MLATVDTVGVGMTAFTRPLRICYLRWNPRGGGPLLSGDAVLREAGVEAADFARTAAIVGPTVSLSMSETTRRAVS
jgi:hypothetical protein